MFGQTWYFDTIRKYVILVGTLFNDIRITKKDKQGNEVALIRVPITYGPKDKMLARVFQDPNIDRQTATIPLPMISFEIGKMTYDNDRKIPTVGRIARKSDKLEEKSKFRYQYNPVPYNINFSVYVYAKNVEDGTKIIEQILPFFTPDWTTRVNLIPEMDVIMDIPVVLNDIKYDDNYAGDLKDRRQIIWTLSFTVKGYIYGPVKKSPIIKFIDMNFYAGQDTDILSKFTMQPGLDEEGNPVNYKGRPEPIADTGSLPYDEISATDNFGFVEMIYDEKDL